jgi:hypothetical protein
MPLPPLHTAAADEPEDLSAVPLVPPDADALVRHPDGWYWLTPDGRQQFGPYEHAADARAALNAAAEDALECGETLDEAESELGLAEWIDPDTGELAEQVHTRLEEH